MRRHSADPRIFRCEDRIRYKGRRTQNIANVMIDLGHGLANIGKPLALAQRQQRIALQRFKGPRRSDKLTRAQSSSAIGLATEGSSLKALIESTSA